MVFELHTRQRKDESTEFVVMRFLIFILLSPVILQAAEFPDTLFLRTSDLQRKKQLIHEDALYKAAYEDLLQRADRTLGKPLYSVMSKTLTPDSGDKHDYMSFGPYWWPDPKKEDGLPFINGMGRSTRLREIHAPIGRNYLH